MKQRLLLCLLMLMVSVGIVKAAIDITIPAGTGNVTIKMTSDTYTFTEGGYIHLILGNQTQKPTGLDSKTITYTIKQTDAEQTAYLSTASQQYHDRGNVTLSVDGKVTEFISQDDGAFTDNIVSIAFTNNGELTRLRLGNTDAATEYYPNLTALFCEGNKLSYIPAKPEQMKAADYKVGKQEVPVNKLQALSGNAESFVLETSAFSKVLVLSNLTKGKDLAIQTLKDKDGNVTTAVKADLVNSVYHFREANGVYVDGNFKADIKVSESNASYPGVVICNVPLTVTPALFDLDFTYDQEHGNSFKIAVNGVEKTAPVTGLKKNDVITLTPIPNETEGYEFTGTFETNGGVSKPTVDGNSYKFTIVGNIDPVIEATFKLKDGVKVTWNTTTTDGEIKVYQNDKLLTGSEAALTVGSVIRVYVKASEGKSIESVKMSNINDADIKDTDDRTDVFDAIVKVPAAGTNIVATFATTTQDLKIVHKSGPTAINVKGDKGTNQTAGDNQDWTIKIPVGENLTITFPIQNDGNYVSSVLVNGETIPTEPTEENTYVIKDFEMPNYAVTMTVNIATLKKLTVELTKDVTYTYNGDEQPVQYVVKNESGAVVSVSGITVYYGGENDKVESFKANSPFKNAGTYKVYFKREAGDTYAEINTSDNPETYTIAKAPLIVNELPKVSVDADKKYQITGGKIGYMVGNTFKEVTNLGEFVVLDKEGTDVTTDQNTATVTIRYKFTETENANYDLKLDDVMIPVEGKDAETITVNIFDNDYSELLVLKNGGAVIKNGDAVPVGSTITMGLTVVDDPNDNISYAVTITDSEGNILSDSDNLWREGSTFTVSADKVKNIDKLIFKLEVVDKRVEIKVAKASEELLTQGGDEKNPTIVYNGQAHAFDASQLTWVTADGKPVTNASINAKAQISYTIDGEVLTSAPVDAGTYTVTLSYDLENYIVKPIQAELTIHKAEFTDAQVPAPSASRVALGQTLDKSNLSGQASIEGTYAWDEEKDASQITVDANKTYKVKFVPAKNYKEAQLEDMVSVEVTTNPIITFDPNPEGGKVTVVNKNDPNDIYKSGDEVFAGTELIITATPDDDFELASLTINGVGVSNPYTVKFDKATIEMEATFKPKSTTVIVPEGQYEIDLPDAVRGAMISYVGDPIVDRGDDFSFTVTTLAADADKLKVTANGLTLKRAANGSYTISDVTEKQTVRISFSSTPTEVKVDIPLVYHEEGHATQGEVSIINNTSGDGKYFYGDELTLIAFPESGVTFEGWSDKSKQQVRELTLTGNVSLRALFSGSPTGIEDIEAARIVAGDGYIQVKNVANANVTVVSMAGRIQTQQRISGDAQIRVPAGIYVVILESGQDVKRTKVIVR